MEQVIDVIEVGKVGVDFDNPVWYTEYHRSNIEQGDLPGEEWFVLDPRDHVVENPGNVEKYCCDRKIPSIGFSICEYECSMGHAEDKLQD